jgi:predicted nuclease of predicted toxin-antitoxin system
MRFKVDENLPMEVAQVLREAGHEAATVLDQHLGGSADPLIASICQQEERTLVTLDLDFADIRAYPPMNYAGLIVFRLRRQDKLHILEVCARMLPLLSRQPLTQRLWIVEEERIRIRR